jgi:Na+-transporting NADH:ubiquinone oxidoreductase subunit C
MPKDRESIGHTFIVAVGVCLICSVLVSAAAVSLSPAQEENKLQERRRNILSAAGLLGPDVDVDTVFQNIQARVVDLRSGTYVEDVDPLSYNQREAADDPQRSTAIPPKEDIADIKRRADKAVVYLYQPEGRLEVVILPIHGLGLWSTLYGFIALESDLRTIAGLAFYEHGETPGLGGEVDNPRWKAKWPGKKAFDEQGRLIIEVVKGEVDPSAPGAEHKVDGLSGATITTRGVNHLVHFWLGEQGFGPYLDKLAERRAGQTGEDAEAEEDA